MAKLESVVGFLPDVFHSLTSLDLFLHSHIQQLYIKLLLAATGLQEDDSTQKRGQIKPIEGDSYKEQ